MHKPIHKTTSSQGAGSVTFISRPPLRILHCSAQHSGLTRDWTSEADHPFPSGLENVRRPAESTYLGEWRGFDFIVPRQVTDMRLIEDKERMRRLALGVAVAMALVIFALWYTG